MIIDSCRHTVAGAINVIVKVAVTVEVPLTVAIRVRARVRSVRVLMSWLTCELAFYNAYIALIRTNRFIPVSHPKLPPQLETYKFLT